MIEAIQLVKTYVNGMVSNTVLKDVSLQVEKGEFVAIMGRSGAGKSTLMYQLSLLDEPTSGEVIIEGIHTDQLREDEKTDLRLTRLGYVFQDYALVPELTATENCSLPLLMQGKTNKESRLSAELALARVGLSARLNNLPSQLSGGEQQRVSIARAIAHSPRILFADEPTANLDNETSSEILQIFKKLNDEGQTIVMVTHEKEYGLIADRIVTLSDGQIVSFR